MLETALEGRHGDVELVACRARDGGFTIEILAATEGVERWSAGEYRALGDAADLAERRQALVERVRELTGFDRVMYYQFVEGGDGTVLAESRGEAATGSYLGLRFPASDIPMIARRLYVENPWRTISDCRAEDVPVLGVDEGPPDLAHTDLRSVSPVHKVYMQNMGLRASLSLPIVIGNELVALVACHGLRPRRLPTALLQRVSHLAGFFNLELRDWQTRERMEMLDGLDRQFDEIRQGLHRAGDLGEAWGEIGARLAELFDADGAVLCTGDRIHRVGSEVDDDSVRALDRWFGEHPELVLATDQLNRHVDGLGLSAMAGVAAVELGTPGAPDGARIYLHRGEQVYEVAWGGNPDKPVEYHDGRLGIAPRRSFEKWVEQRFGHSRPWPTEARLKLLRLRDLLKREMRP